MDSGENTGNLDVKLRAPIDKEGEETRDARTCATRLAGIPGAQYEFTRPSLLTLATPVEVILAGYDLDRSQARGERGAHAHGSERRVQGHPLQHRRRPS